VISRKKIREFAAKWPAALGPLTFWADAVESSTWKNFSELKATFRSADYFKEFTIFDVGGNNWRVITFIHYRKQLVFIKHILTHKEYDKGAWKQ